MTPRRSGHRSRRGRREAAVVAALALLPWTVLSWSDGVSAVFAWGLLNPAPPHVVLLSDYLFRFSGGPAGLPERLLAWPMSVLLYLGALASAAGGFLGCEDRRVTGGLLVFAGVSHLGFTLGLQQPGMTVVPVGPVALWAVSWWVYGGDLRRAVGEWRCSE
jgi:uncharacterized protein (TIGR04206 family)